jgi:hypothetical protein
MEMNIEHPTLKWKRVKSLNWEWGEESEVRGQRSLGKMKKWLPQGAWASCLPFFEW